jgi:tmRNA-binding protein
MKYDLMAAQLLCTLMVKQKSNFWNELVRFHKFLLEQSEIVTLYRAMSDQEATVTLKEGKPIFLKSSK